MSARMFDVQGLLTLAPDGLLPQHRCGKREQKSCLHIGDCLCVILN